MHDSILREFAPGCSNNAWFSQARSVASESVMACHPERRRLSAKRAIFTAGAPVVELRPDKAGPSTRVRIVAADPPAWSG